MRTWRIAAALIGFAAYVIWDGKRISERKRNSRIARGKRFAIVGAGFAGVEAAKELARQLPDEDSQILLIDQRDYLLFTPMLTEAVGARIQPHHIIVPLASFSKRIKHIRGVVTGIDIHRKTIAFADGKPGPITADYLVIALGATSNFHHVAGVEQIAFTLKSLDDAEGIRRSAMEMVKSASEEDDPEKRRAKLTFLVAGGGYTGVEAIAALNELVRDGARKFASLRNIPVEMTIAEPLGRLMSEVSEGLASYSQRELEQAGVRVLLNTAIKSAAGRVIELSNGEHVKAGTFIWTAGIEANPLVSSLGAPTGKGGALKVSGCLQLEQFEGVWAVGDSAEVPKPGGHGTYGATAQNAMREGKLAARNILRQLRGEPQQPFRYKPIGQLALVGKHKGVAQVYGFQFSGLIAYLLWRGVYIMKMPSIAQRLRVISDWCADVVLGPADEYAISSAHTERNPMRAQR